MPPHDFPNIDRDRLRSRARRLDNWTLLTLFDRAIEHVPEHAMEDLLGGCLATEEVAETNLSIVEEVEEFYRLSHTRHFYESFDVNWKNSHKTSRGTEHWLAECARLFRKCATQARLGVEAVLPAFELLFDLLDDIDSGVEIVFFADEGGSYLVTPGWENVLPAYFACLAQATVPEEYAKRALKAIGFDINNRLLRAAHEAATSEQRQALPPYCD